MTDYSNIPTKELQIILSLLSDNKDQAEDYMLMKTMIYEIDIELEQRICVYT